MMNKLSQANKRRFYVWSIVCAIVTIAAIVGIVSYFSGYGKLGALRKDLKPVETAFNKLLKLEPYKQSGITIEAEYNEEGINVTYKSATIKEIIYQFKYEKIDGKKVIHYQENNISNTNTVLVLESMIEAVSVADGHRDGEVFTKFILENLYLTTLEDGVFIEVDEKNDTHVYINLENTLLEANVHFNNDQDPDKELKLAIIEKTKNLVHKSLETFTISEKKYSEFANIRECGYPLDTTLDPETESYYIKISENGEILEIQFGSGKYAIIYIHAEGNPALSPDEIGTDRAPIIEKSIKLNGTSCKMEEYTVPEITPEVPVEPEQPVIPEEPVVTPEEVVPETPKLEQNNPNTENNTTNETQNNNQAENSQEPQQEEPKEEQQEQNNTENIATMPQ